MQSLRGNEFSKKSMNNARLMKFFMNSFLLSDIVKYRLASTENLHKIQSQNELLNSSYRGNIIFIAIMCNILMDCILLL